MGNKAENQINDEIYTGVVPALKKDRIYDSKAITIAAAGFGVASWCYVQGGWISSLLPFHLAVIVSLIPMIVFGLLMMLCVIIPTRYGIDLWIYQKAVFGYGFCSILCIVAILTNWGWYAVNSNVFANASSTLLKMAGIPVSSAAIPWLGSLCAILGLVLAMKGPHLVKYATYIMVPCLLAVGLLLLIKTMSTTTLTDLMNSKPMYADTYPSTKIAFLCMVEAMFGFIFAWYPVLGSMSRITKTERASYWGQSAGYIGAMAFFVIIGVVSSTLMGNLGVYSTDPTDWLAHLGNPVWQAVSIGAIALANITTQTLGCYCLSLATKIFKPSWDYRKIAAGYTVFVIAMIFWQGVWEYYNVFLAATAVIGAPACAIIVVDYFLVRKGNVSLRSMFKIKGEDSYEYTFGCNIPAVISFALAVASYLFIYDPLNYVVRNETLMKFTPTGIAFVVAGLSYFLMCQIPAVKAYVLRDAKEAEVKYPEEGVEA
ncbi:MAG: cytosine permease [Anaerostipes sp.]|nr:cytosine permease [Anaerostipes sp.]